MSTNGRLFWRNTGDIDPMPIIDALAREQGNAWEARQFAALWKETARREVRKVHDEDGLVMRAVRAAKTIATENGFLRDDLAKAEQQRDRWKEVAEVNQEELDHLHSDTPRPLTADELTDEAIRRARVAWLENAQNEGIPSAPTIRAMFAALTSPPSRPEWADLADKIDDAMAGPGGIDGDTLAERLHAEGVRVTGAES